MQSPVQTSRGYSARVRMELRLNGQSVAICQMGPDFVVLEQPFEHPPVDAELFVQIDESQDIWSVRLVEGISPTRRKTKTVPLSR